MPQQQIQLPSNVPPGNQPSRPQLPIQPNPNPNNKGVHQTNTLNLPSYRISTTELYEMNFQLGQTINVQSPPVIIEQLDGEGKESKLNDKCPEQIDRN